MSCAVPFAGTQMELHGDGVAWFPEHKILCASDIHFEKGSFFQRFSTLLPPYDTRDTLHRLSAALERFKPDRFVSLGDAFHDTQALERMQHSDRQQLEAMITSTPQWIWVEGNHDVNMKDPIGGARHAEFTACGMTFRHIAEPQAKEWELSGHYHPKARVSIRGHSLRLPCFVTSEKRIIMPAFGSYTGGLDVTSDVISSITPLPTRELFLLHKCHLVKWRE